MQVLMSKFNEEFRLNGNCQQLIIIIFILMSQRVTNRENIENIFNNYFFLNLYSENIVRFLFTRIKKNSSKKSTARIKQNVSLRSSYAVYDLHTKCVAGTSCNTQYILD